MFLLIKLSQELEWQPIVYLFDFLYNFTKFIKYNIFDK